jgi:uncharacterized membrane protein YedE/YeeE
MGFVTPLIGGILIGAAASGLLLFNGRLAGISNIVGDLLPPEGRGTRWRAAFVAGLLAGGVLLLFWYPESFHTPPRSLPLLAVAGLLVGFGSRVSNGCTSGHGVCGLGRRSGRALAATVTFMVTGMATVYLFEHLLRAGVR